MRPVYNLTVADVPEFFANGVLVHNCDSALYLYKLLYAYLADEIVDRPKYGTKEYWRVEAAEAKARAMKRKSEDDDEMEWLA